MVCSHDMQVGDDSPEWTKTQWRKKVIKKKRSSEVQPVRPESLSSDVFEPDDDKVGVACRVM